MLKINPFILLFSRILIALPFFFTAIGSIFNFSATKTLFLSIKGFPFPTLSLIIGIGILLLGSISLIIGYKIKIGTILLMIFVVFAAFFYHRDFQNPLQIINFFKNIAIFGGLLIIYFLPPGKYSIKARNPLE